MQLPILARVDFVVAGMRRERTNRRRSEGKAQKILEVRNIEVKTSRQRREPWIQDGSRLMGRFTASILWGTGFPAFGQNEWRQPMRVD